MVALLGFLFLGEKVDKYQSFLLVLTFIGIVLAYSDKPFTFENQDFLGMLAALGASMTNAATVVLFKSEAKNYHSLEMVFYQNIAGVFIFLPFFIIGVAHAEIADIGLGTLFGLIAGIIVFGLFFHSLKYLNAATASTLMYLEVVSAILFGYLFFNEVLGVNMVLGGFLIMASNLLLVRFDRKNIVQDIK